MGIKDFKKVFNNHGHLSLKQLKGLKIAVDAMGELYRGILGTSKVDQLTDKDGQPTNYIGVLIGVIRNFYLNDVTQIWVFDSPVPHPLKYVLLERSKNRANANQKLDELNGIPTQPHQPHESLHSPPHHQPQQTQQQDQKQEHKVAVDMDDPLYAMPASYVDMGSSDDDTEHTDKAAKKKKHQLQKQAFQITGKMINNVRRILDGFGIPHITAPPGIEAEHVAAQLAATGVVDAVFTNDPDALVFGAPRIIMRNRDKKMKKSKYTEFVDYHLSLLLKESKLTHSELVETAIILGCDFYSDKNDPDDDDDARPYFKGIGAKTVLKKRPILVKRGVFGDPLVKQAMNAFSAPIPPYTIVNEESLAGTKGHRPFRSSKKINAMIEWLVNDLSFDPDPLVERFRETFGLDKIKYRKPKSASSTSAPTPTVESSSSDSDGPKKSKKGKIRKDKPSKHPHDPFLGVPVQYEN